MGEESLLLMLLLLLLLLLLLATRGIDQLHFTAEISSRTTCHRSSTNSVCRLMDRDIEPRDGDSPQGNTRRPAHTTTNVHHHLAC